ncbi:MAG: hypothetical protein J6K45_02270 [Clostridia bacterium]|nr:hypothetical protein [Clostridia bacterium]MBP3503402.1 hypothetical protein [Clostridia bacterium]
MKNVRSMTYKELFENFKIILNMKYMPYIITNEKALDAFYRDYPRTSTNEEQSSFLKMFFEKYSKYIDNEAYVFFTLKTFREEMPTQQYQYVAQRCIDALKGSNYAFFDINRAATKPGDEIKLLKASDFTGEQISEEETDNQRRIKDLKEKMDLKTLFTIHSPSEMRKIYGLDKDLSIYLTKLGMIEAVSEFKDLSMRDRIRLLSDDKADELSKIITENSQKLQAASMDKFYFRMAEYLEKYPDYFDLDKLMLIAAFRANQYLEEAKLTEEEKKDFSNLLIVLKDAIKSKGAKVTGLLPNDGNGRENYEYSYKALCRACNRIADNGIYLSTTDELMIRDSIESNPSSVNEIDPAYLKIMKFTFQEMNMLCEIEGNLKFLFENGVINRIQLPKILASANVPESDFCELVNSGFLDDSSINSYLNHNNIIGENVFNVLNSKGIFSPEDKLKYYMNGRIELSYLENISDEEKKALRELLSPEELIELYRLPGKEAEYMRYSALYRELIIKDADRKEKEEISEKIIEATNGDLEDEDFIKFYDQYLITLSTLESWTGSYLVTRLMREAKLRPADVKEMCKDGNYDSVIAIMKDPLISRNNKLAIYRTTFTADKHLSLTEEQRELKELAKEEALKALNLRESRFSNDTARKSGTTRTGEGSNKKRNEYVSEPLNRWELIELLDKDYSYEMLSSGMMIFKLPNVQGGLIILEKMYKNSRPDYARATKVIKMTIEDFEKIKADLIIDGDIPSSAVDSHPALNKKCDSIWHTQAWGQRIAELAGYRTDPRRSKENIESIEDEIDTIKRSRRLRE